MSVFFEITTSLDGFVAGTEPSLEDPLGRGGVALHEWAFRLRAWREPHGRAGGEEGPEDAQVRAGRARAGAVIMGRTMFSGGSGPWESDPNASGWWGQDPPFKMPVFVLTHHARDPLPMDGGTTFHFVTGGVESALEQATAAAGGKDVQVAGGASAGQQFLEAGLLDELLIHTAPVLLGGGTRLLEHAPVGVRLEIAETLAGRMATHVRYRVAR
jgi:dihydrofolate reductase